MPLRQRRRTASRPCKNLAEGEPYSMCDCMFYCDWQHHCLSLICRFEAARIRQTKLRRREVGEKTKIADAYEEGWYDGWDAACQQPDADEVRHLT